MLEIQFSRNVSFFGNLCFFQCRAWVGKVGAGILHVLVEKQVIELTGKIVMVRHMILGAVCWIELGESTSKTAQPPPEFLQELRVNTSMYDAQQGATAGAQIDVNTFAGTNDWHGQAYGNFADGSWNASPYFFNQ